MRATYSDSETMSVTDNAPVGDTAPSESPVDLGDTPAAEPVEAVSQEPGERYTVTIDGEAQEVSLDELRNGYQRQSDYTRKTQELAETRKRLSSAERLANALDTDPVTTLKALNEAYQIDGMSQAEWDEMDPQEQRIAKLEQQLDEQRARDARSTIESEFRALESEFGDFDRNDIAGYAFKHGLTVTDAYRVMNFDSLRQEKNRLAEEAKVVDSKRNAQLPHTAGSAQRGAVTSATPTKHASVRDAYLAAVKQQAGA